MALEDVFVCSNQELEQFLTKVYKCIAQGTLETKIATLVYLENLCGHMQVADLVVNSSLLKLVLKMVQVKSTELRGVERGEQRIEILGGNGGQVE